MSLEVDHQTVSSKKISAQYWTHNIGNPKTVLDFMSRSKGYLEGPFAEGLDGRSIGRNEVSGLCLELVRG